MEKRNIHFFVPVYFDTPSFLRLRQEIEAILPKDCHPYFHLLDDTAGLDPAVSAVRFPNVATVAMPFNLGHQRALVFGLRRLLPEIEDSSLVVTMDGDGEDRPADLPQLLTAFSAGSTAPVVLARRTSRQESLFFKFFYFFYKFFFRTLTGTVIQTGNYALTSAGALRQIIFHPYFDLCYASSLFALASRPVFVPCPRGKRFEGRSKMNFVRLALHGVNMLMPFMDRIAVRGAVAFTAFFTASFLISAALATLHIFGIWAVPHWVMFSGALGFVLSFVALGNFAVLLTVFANAQGLAMARLTQRADRP